MKKIFILYIIGLISINKAYSQQPELNNKIADNLFSDFKKEEVHKRKMIIVTKKNRFNPLVYFFGGLLYVYQNIISEQIQASCQYHLSCSDYMKKIIQKKGLLVGVLKGTNQLINCAPYVLNDYPDCKHTKYNKIDNSDIE